MASVADETPRTHDTADRETDPDGVAEIVPAQVREHLVRGTCSVLVDEGAVEAVRRRFDDEQAGALGRYLASAQSANTLRAYRSDWIAFTAWCLAEGRRSLPADPVDVAVYLAAAADTVRPDDPARWALAPSTLERVRFTSPHPRDFTDDVIEAMAET
ncbi:hypothetical protein ACFQZU_22255, partial [Streptomonospora algeriensis]